jgi:hypothetical protein
MGELTGGGVFVSAADWLVVARLPRCVCFDPRPGEVMLPRIGLALVLCVVFPCLVQGVDILMDPYGNGSLFAFVSPVAVQILRYHSRNFETMILLLLNDHASELNTSASTTFLHCLFCSFRWLRHWIRS